MFLSSRPADNLMPTIADIAACLAARPVLQTVVTDNSARPAAVLLLLTQKNNAPHILFTRRTAHLVDHGGEISFPGGKIDPDDTTAAAAALREAQEEIGLSPDSVRILGTLGLQHTLTGFSVCPVVGTCTPPPQWVRNAAEVSEIFSVPLSHFLTPAGRLHRRTAVRSGIVHHFYACTWEGMEIWGATAAILKSLLDALGTEAQQ